MKWQSDLSSMLYINNPGQVISNPGQITRANYCCRRESCHLWDRKAPLQDVFLFRACRHQQGSRSQQRNPSHWLTLASKDPRIDGCTASPPASSPRETSLREMETVSFENILPHQRPLYLQLCSLGSKRDFSYENCPHNVNPWYFPCWSKSWELKRQRWCKKAETRATFGEESSYSAELQVSSSKQVSAAGRLSLPALNSTLSS